MKLYLPLGCNAIAYSDFDLNGIIIFLFALKKRQNGNDGTQLNVNYHGKL